MAIYPQPKNKGELIRAKNKRIREFRVFFCFEIHMAAGEGFEPSQTDPESVVLPLHNPAISATVVIIAQA